MTLAPQLATRSMFSTGYADGLWSRPANPGRCTDRELAKYSEGYRLGVEDRLAGRARAGRGHLVRPKVAPSSGSGGGPFGGVQSAAPGDVPPTRPVLSRGRPRTSGAPSPSGLPDALIALRDALSDTLADETLRPGAHLLALMLDSELTTDTQHRLLAALVYELADTLALATV